jgi:hypothetical protein
VTLGEFIMWLIKFGFTSVEPLIAQAIEGFKNDKITAEEADRIAEGKFTTMLAAFKDPRAESAAMDKETERQLHEKFDHSDAKNPSEEPKPE